MKMNFKRGFEINCFEILKANVLLDCRPGFMSHYTHSTGRNELIKICHSNAKTKN